MIDLLRDPLLLQHVAVFVVALAAAVVVVRKVLGVFEGRPVSTSASSAGAPHAVGPSCSHCAAGTAAQAGRGSPTHLPPRR